MSCGSCQKCRSGCVSIKEFAYRVVPHAAGAPMSLIEDKVQETLQDFAKRTGVIERVLSFDTQSCVDEYFLDIPCDEKIVRINKITDRDCYCPTPLRERPCKDLCQDRYYFERSCTLYLAPVPQCDGTKIYVEATMMPSRRSCEVDDRFFEYHSDAIVAGTIVHMASMSQSEWFSAGVLREMKERYEDKVICASALEKRQYSGAPMKLKSGGWI